MSRKDVEEDLYQVGHKVARWKAVEDTLVLDMLFVGVVDGDHAGSFLHLQVRDQVAKRLNLKNKYTIERKVLD